MFGWFHRRWVSRSEHEAMKRDYEAQITSLKEIASLAMNAVSAGADAHTEDLQVAQAMMEKLGNKITPDKLN